MLPVAAIDTNSPPSGRGANRIETSFAVPATGRDDGGAGTGVDAGVAADGAGVVVPVGAADDGAVVGARLGATAAVSVGAVRDGLGLETGAGPRVTGDGVVGVDVPHEAVRTATRRSDKPRARRTNTTGLSGTLVFASASDETMSAPPALHQRRTACEPASVQRLAPSARGEGRGVVWIERCRLVFWAVLGMHRWSQGRDPSGCGVVGNARALGARDRGFESHRPDHQSGARPLRAGHAALAAGTLAWEPIALIAP